MKDDQHRKQRLLQLKRMIMELSMGNFSYRIPPSALEDEIASFELLLNMMAEEISELAFYNSPRERTAHKMEMLFILDEKFYIVNVNKAAQNLLHYAIDELTGKEMTSFLLPRSKKNWHRLLQSTPPFSKNNQILELVFKTKSGFNVPALCTLSFLESKETNYWVMISLQTMIKPRPLRPNQKKPLRATSKNFLQLDADIQKIRQVHEYVLQNLDKPLPHLNKISRKFQLNEYKLKKGFKEIYHTTIYRFHLHERLKQAYILIQNSPMSLKTIAFSLGFKSFPHFSRVFKQRFGMAPRKFRKISNQK